MQSRMTCLMLIHLSRLASLPINQVDASKRAPGVDNVMQLTSGGMDDWKLSTALHAGTLKKLLCTGFAGPLSKTKGGPAAFPAACWLSLASSWIPLRDICTHLYSGADVDSHHICYCVAQACSGHAGQSQFGPKHGVYLLAGGDLHRQYQQAVPP